MEKHQEIINILSQCVSACEFCATSCLNEPSVQELKNCIQLDRDCADICSLAIQLLSRDSDQTASIINICADVCAKCAEECERHDHDHCVRCAQACRKCQQSCKDYLNRVAKEVW